MSTYQDNIETLREMIKDIDITMMTTIEPDGSLRSRPMSTQQVEFDGDLWFFTAVNTSKAADIQHNGRVNLGYSAPNKQRYVSVSGTAELINDRAKMEALWSPIYRAYFRDGLEDPALRLIKVRVEKAEYWDSPGGLVATIIGFAKTLTGQEPEMGENKELNLNA